MCILLHCRLVASSMVVSTSPKRTSSSKKWAKHPSTGHWAHERRSGAALWVGGWWCVLVVSMRGNGAQLRVHANFLLAPLTRTPNHTARILRIHHMHKCGGGGGYLVDLPASSHMLVSCMSKHKLLFFNTVRLRGWLIKSVRVELYQILYQC